jgi:dolichol-phosphate mannosyltransferase
MKLSVIIPARNEALNLEATLKSLSEKLNSENIEHEILVIDDHSSDETMETLKRLSLEIPYLRVLKSPSPHGFGLAIRTGLEDFQGDAAAIFMADGSDSPEDLVAFFRAMEATKVDCVFGSRFIAGGRTVEYPILKLILNRLANGFIRLLFGIDYNDTTNAFKLYHRRALEGVKPYLSRHFNLTVELPLKAIIRGYTWVVLPNQWRNRKKGFSKLKIKEMGSRYLFIVLYCLIEKWLSRGDYSQGPIQFRPKPFQN